MNQVINTKSQGKLCGQTFSLVEEKSKNKQNPQTGRKKRAREDSLYQCQDCLRFPSEKIFMNIFLGQRLLSEYGLLNAEAGK